MQEHTIPICQLFLPILLPFGEGMFFQQVMTFQNDKRSGGFKANATFYTYYGITDVNISSDGKRFCYDLQCMDSFEGSVKNLTIDANQFTFSKLQGYRNRIGSG